MKSSIKLGNWSSEPVACLFTVFYIEKFILTFFIIKNLFSHFLLKVIISSIFLRTIASFPFNSSFLLPDVNGSWGARLSWEIGLLSWLLIHSVLYWKLYSHLFFKMYHLYPLFLFFSIHYSSYLLAPKAWKKRIFKMYILPI